MKCLGLIVTEIPFQLSWKNWKQTSLNLINSTIYILFLYKTNMGIMYVNYTMVASTIVKNSPYQYTSLQIKQ